MGLLQQAWRCTEQGPKCTQVELYMFGEEEKWEMSAKSIDICMVSAVWEYPISIFLNTAKAGEMEMYT